MKHHKADRKEGKSEVGEREVIPEALSQCVTSVCLLFDTGFALWTPLKGSCGSQVSPGLPAPYIQQDGKIPVGLNLNGKEKKVPPLCYSMIATTEVGPSSVKGTYHHSSLLQCLGRKLEYR